MNAAQSNFRGVLLKALILALIGIGFGIVYSQVSDVGLEPRKSFAWTKSDDLSIDLAEAKRAFDAKGVFFIDARMHRSYVGSHIPGALNLTLQEAQMRAGELLAKMPREAPIVTYCSGGTCQSSVKLARFLSEEMGFSNVRAFYDGWPAWIAAGYPTKFGEQP